MDKTGSDRSMPRSITRLVSSTASNHNVRIPIRIEDCAHFHYDKVELASITISLYTSPSSSGSLSAASVPTTPTTLADHQQHNFQNQRTPYCGISPDTSEFFFTALVQSRGQSWLIRRTYAQLKNFDKMLHQCAWDRHVSRLEPPPSIMELSQVKKDVDEYKSFVHSYLGRLTALTGSGSGGFSASPMGSYYNQSHMQTGTGNVACSLITCGPVLNFLEMDNRGNRLIPFCQDSEINTPAIAAVHVTRGREPGAKDELQLEVGDIISVIDMPPPKESNWWRGKRGLEVGYFPADCVQVISVSHTPRGSGNALLTAKHRAGQTPGSSSRGVGVMSLEEAQKRQPAVLKSRNKLSAVLRNFFTHRPPRGLLRQAGLLQERVFGCDLAEHIDRLARADLLLAADHQKVPVVVVACCQFVELYCLHSDGVYRRSGVQSNIQKLRQEFDNMDNYYSMSGAALTDTATKRAPGDAARKEAPVDAAITIPSAPFLDREQFRTDIHCVPSVLKQYFRELPNPLLTHQLFHSFLRVTRLEAEPERIELLRQTVALLPPPHYQTLKFLMKHLHRLATDHAAQTAMNEKNLARVWGPNLLRKPEQGSLDAGISHRGAVPPTETSDVTSSAASAAAAIQIMGSKGGNLPLRNAAGISNPVNPVKITGGTASASVAETANLEMMTEVVQGAVIVELMIRQYDVIFEQSYRQDDDDEDGEVDNHATYVMDEGGDFSLDAAAAAANNDLPAHYDVSSKTPFRISFRRQQQKQLAGKTAVSRETALTAEPVPSSVGGTSSAKVARRNLPAATAAAGAAFSSSKHSSKADSDQARRNKTISMLQTEEFFPHFAAGVKLIALQDAADSQQAARNSTINLSTTSSLSYVNSKTPTPMQSIKSNTLPTVRPPSSVASSSFSREFSDCDDDDEIADPRRQELNNFDNELFPAVQRRERRQNGKSPERAPSSASRKSTKSTGSQLAASVKSKLKWPFGKHKNKSEDDEPPQRQPMKAVQKPSTIGTNSSFAADCPLIDASPSISTHTGGSTTHSVYAGAKTNEFSRRRAGHERMMSADYAVAPQAQSADEFYTDEFENDDAEQQGSQRSRHRRNVASIASFFDQRKQSIQSTGKIPINDANPAGGNAELYYNKHNLSDSEPPPAMPHEGDDAAPPVYANLASLAGKHAVPSQSHSSVNTTKYPSAINTNSSSSNNNKKRLSTFSSSIVNVHTAPPQQPQPSQPSILSASSSTLTTRTLPSAGSGPQQYQPLYANNTMIIDALKKRHLQQQQKQDENQQAVESEVVRTRPCSREFSSAGALLTFDVAAASRKSASVGSNNAVDDDEELDVVACVDLPRTNVGSNSSVNSWATQSLPARARARKKV